MTVTDFDFICQILKQRSGLILGNDKAYLLESRLLPVARKYRLASFEELVRMIATGHCAPATNAAANARQSRICFIRC